MQIEYTKWEESHRIYKLRMEKIVRFGKIIYNRY